MFKPNSLTVCATLIASPLTRIGSRSTLCLAKEILCSLHLATFSWNLFSLDFSTSSSTSFWIVLALVLTTFSAMVVSPTYFHKSGLLVSMSCIMRINSHEPSFVPCGTPAGVFLHSDMHSRSSLTLCWRFFRKSITQQVVPYGISNVSSFRTRSV